MARRKRIRRLITIDTDLNDALISKAHELDVSVNLLCSTILRQGIAEVGVTGSLRIGPNFGSGIVTPRSHSQRQSRPGRKKV